MKRIQKNIPDKFDKEQLFQWAATHHEVCILDSNNQDLTYTQFDYIVAVGAVSTLKLYETHDAFKQLASYKQSLQDWLFGYISYDTKNDVEALISSHPNTLNFPEIYYFQPSKIFYKKNGKIEVSYITSCENELDNDVQNICQQTILNITNLPELNLQSPIAKNAYNQAFSQLQQHISKGNFYEINYCIPFYQNNIEINPFELFLSMNRKSKAPQAAYLQFDNQAIISSSPERFLQKNGSTIIAQPIKGTRKRTHNSLIDKQLVNDLTHSIKERSENIMVVDLIRNDLATIAQKGSVEVVELCKVYQFESIIQMISTIKARLDNEVDTVSVLQKNFPMGSMTGAPKIKVMQTLDTVECFRRNAYSGALGYFTPADDFDHNVLIRTFLYNISQKQLFYAAGSAITFLANSADEYEECILKKDSIVNLINTP